MIHTYCHSCGHCHLLYPGQPCAEAPLPSQVRGQRVGEKPATCRQTPKVLTSPETAVRPKVKRGVRG